jgi:hypothetical protein
MALYIRNSDKSQLITELEDSVRKFMLMVEQENEDKAEVEQMLHKAEMYLAWFKKDMEHLVNENKQD